MLWSLVLPFWIDIVVLTAFVVTATVASPSLRLNRDIGFLLSVVIAIVGFVPMFWGTMHVVDAIRFGTFRHKTFQDVRDRYVEQYLPEFAVDILLDKHAQGFCAKFRTDQKKLTDWHSERSQKWKIPIESARRMHDYESYHCDQHFARLGWKLPTDAVVFNGVHAENGAGFELWFSASEGIAYQVAGYW